jgi:hypothetical protein
MDNREDYDVKSATFTGASAASMVSGRAWLLGFGIGLVDSQNSVNPTIEYQGSILLRDSASSGGDIMFEVPVVGNFKYQPTIFTSFADEDAYILFENGIGIDQTTESGKNSPFSSLNVYITYR